MTDHSAVEATAGSVSKFTVREILLAITLAGLVVLSSLNVVDEYAEADLESLFQRALISFALARTLNGVISAVQGTEVALQPAGVGVTLTPGEILDPVNDLVERFSWIMLGATISLGIQQVMLDIGQWWGMRVLVIMFSLLWLMLRLWRHRKGSPAKGLFEQGLLYLLIAVIFMRFAVPLALIANEAVYALFLESRYLTSTQELQAAGHALERLDTEVTGNSAGGPGAESESKSFFGQVIDGARRTLDLEQKVDAVKQKTARLIEHLIQLSVVFILQTGILPLVFLWLLLALFRFILRFRSRIPQFASP
jgi:hypothetical protein